MGRVEQDLRDLALGLDPGQVFASGLAASLEDLARDHPVPVDLRVDAHEVPREVAIEAYLVCAEALTNVAKHAGATAVLVEVERGQDNLVLTVSDDGVGGASFDAGTGLRGLADRAESLGGTLALRSDPGGGTQLVAVLPLRGGSGAAAQEPRLWKAEPVAASILWSSRMPSSRVVPNVEPSIQAWRNDE